MRTEVRLDSTPDPSDFEALVHWAEGLPLRGWSFDAIEAHWERGHPPWELRELVLKELKPTRRFLDLGTGGGEFLSTLVPLPKQSWATEGFAPNLALARSTLAPLGVTVLAIGPDRRIDLPDGSIDVTLDRHESYDPREVARVLAPGGIFITQQVGRQNYVRLRKHFGAADVVSENRTESAVALADELRRVGLTIREQREAFWTERFLDVGAVVYFLRMAPWEVPDFSSERHRASLEALHQQIRAQGPWEMGAHRLLVIAVR